MVKRDLREWSPTALILLPAALGWILPLVTSSVHVSGFWWLLLLAVSLMLVAAIIFIAHPMKSLSASSEQLERKISSLERIAETYNSELGSDAQETIKVCEDLDAARERLAEIRLRKARKERVAAPEATGRNAVVDRPTMTILGIVAILLPVTLVAGHALALRNLDVLSSLSVYYFSNMRDALVGSLCAIGILLIRARGDSLSVSFTTIAGLLAITAGLTHPTTLVPRGGAPVSQGDILVGAIHSASVSALVMLTGALCFIVFPRIHQGDKRTGFSVTRGQMYKICGFIIICSVAAATIFQSVATGGHVHLLLWSEVTWLFTFGFACIVRGSAVPVAPSPVELSHQRTVLDDHDLSAIGPGSALGEARPTRPQPPQDSTAPPQQASPPS